MHAVVRLALKASLLPLLMTGAHAQAAAPASDFPAKPVRMIVPNAPGTSGDTLGRIVAIALGEVLRQQVIVDNRHGAGGTIGMEIGRNANPDGYTIIFASPPSLTIAPFVQKRPPFDLRDFEFVASLAVTPNVLVVHNALPIDNVAQLVEHARAKKGALHMASGGTGSQSHLAGALLLSLGKFDSLHVPYKGGAAVPAVMAGEAHWSINPAPAVLSLVRAGKVRAIGHSLPKRTALLPDLPAIAETVPGYVYSAWNGLLAPRNTPRPILERLRSAVAKALQSKQLIESFVLQATEVLVLPPEEFRKLVQETMEQNRRMVQQLNLTVE